MVKGYMSNVNLVFFGTPEPAAEIFEYLRKAGFVPQLVVTNPDKLQGRKMILTPSTVKLWAIANNIPFLQPKNLHDSSFASTLHVTRYTLFIVVAYGGIIPKEILAIPKHGTLNVHYSLLPKYRGASPIESQILNDDKNVGISIMLLDEKMDHGPVLAQQKLDNLSGSARSRVAGQLKTYNLHWPPTATALRMACNDAASKLLVKTIPEWINGEIKPQPQDETQATYTHKITAEDRHIDFGDDGYKNFLKIQAFAARGTYFFVERNNKKIRVLIKDAEFRDGELIIKRVVPEGKKEMSYKDFLRGNQ
ncbi:MAG: methionyl-tRNA formyltransferase [bacterium]|nr:methionyl-tRNA formyltransferase [bacterium]